MNYREGIMNFNDVINIDDCGDIEQIWHLHKHIDRKKHEELCQTIAPNGQHFKCNYCGVGLDREEVVFLVQSRTILAVTCKSCENF